MDYLEIILNENLFMMLVYIFEVIINLMIWLFIFRLVCNFIKRKTNYNYFKNNVIINKKNELELSNKKRIYNDVPKEKLAEFNTDDIDSLKDYFYQLFLDFENAYNNLDYNIMKILSTKQLYQNYYTGISLNLKVGKKRIISDIEKKQVIIFELDSTVAKQVVSAMIEISYINYMIDKNGYIISGSRDKKIVEKFEVIYRKDFDRQEIKNCPNCGADVVGNKCNYCRSIVKNEEFKIGSIKKIVDN